jgi:predicted transcriptional regulator
MEGFMSILDLCVRDVLFCEKSSTLKQASQTMKKHNVGSLVVVDYIGSKIPAGFLTDRDIVLGIAADNHSLLTQVTDIMSNDIVTVQATEGIADVVNLMDKEGVRRVIILDKMNHVVGIVSADDILQLVAQEMKGISNLLRKQHKKESSVKLLQETFLT